MIYLDCGFWQGRALEIYKDKGIVDDTWTIYAFEPNPDIEVEKYVAKYALPIQLIKKAVWIKNGNVNFLISGRPDAARISKEGVEVDTIDFPEFVSNLPDEAIICNMDIEGAEFTVLPKMIADGSISKISILEIEFHHRLMEKYEKADAEKLIDDLVRAGVKVIIKVPL